MSELNNSYPVGGVMRMIKFGGRICEKCRGRAEPGAAGYVSALAKKSGRTLDYCSIECHDIHRGVKTRPVPMDIKQALAILNDPRSLAAERWDALSYVSLHSTEEIMK